MTCGPDGLKSISHRDKHRLGFSISCKMGRADVNTLNELVTISRRFGSRYALPLLISLKELRTSNPRFMDRAEQMGVEVICGYELEERRFRKRLQTISRRWGSMLDDDQNDCDGSVRRKCMNE